MCVNAIPTVEAGVQPLVQHTQKAVPPSGGFVCHPNTVHNIFSIAAYLGFTFFVFSVYCTSANSLPLMFCAGKGTQSVYRTCNSCALQCRVKASFHESGKSAL